MADEARDASGRDGGASGQGGGAVAELLSAGIAAAGTLADQPLRWASVVERLQTMWLDFQKRQFADAASAPTPLIDLGRIAATTEAWAKQLPLGDLERQKQLLGDLYDLWGTVLGRFGIGPNANPGANPGAGASTPLPRSDPRFEDARWRESPLFALLHQSYLLLAERVIGFADAVDGLDPTRKRGLAFTTRAIVDALSPANFPLTNPVVLDRALQTGGASLIRGMEHLLTDMSRGQLTHSPPDAFRLGETIAATPGKVIHQTPLYQLIQYTPTTEAVSAVPLVIFPPWINRFYILDLNPKKSFVRWAVAQGLSVFIVSWRSADASMAEIMWDDYIAAQREAIELVRARLDVPAVHTLGYCVAGTTLAATLAVLAREGEAARVASATFLTAQVDFSEAGDLTAFTESQTLDTIERLSPEGFLDGRYLAATFNLLRGNDLIWSYVGRHYLMGEDAPAFDMLHWNGDVTNLPARWHRSYMRDLYRDNRLVEPDALSAGGVPLDLRRIATPVFIQAGREDHIAPPASVWKLTRHLAGPWTFVLAGSGHIAGVVNPPETNKYQYWTNDRAPETLDAFLAGATEHPGSWWPAWRDWLRARDAAEVPARGRRRPGESADDTVIEDAPGSYVRQR